MYSAMRLVSCWIQSYYDKNRNASYPVIQKGLICIHLITGPAVGAWLYGIGGFMLPFITVGSMSLVFSSLLVVTISSNLFKDRSNEPEMKPLVAQKSFDMTVSSISCMDSNTEVKAM